MKQSQTQDSKNRDCPMTFQSMLSLCVVIFSPQCLFHAGMDFMNSVKHAPGLHSNQLVFASVLWFGGFGN